MNNEKKTCRAFRLAGLECLWFCYTPHKPQPLKAEISIAHHFLSVNNIPLYSIIFLYVCQHVFFYVVQVIFLLLSYLRNFSLHLIYFFTHICVLFIVVGELCCNIQHFNNSKNRRICPIFRRIQRLSYGLRPSTPCPDSVSLPSASDRFLSPKRCGSPPDSSETVPSAGGSCC